MGKSTTTPAKTEAPKKERTIRTLDEQIADALAKAEALKAKAESRKTKVVDEAKEKRAKLVVRRDKLNVEIDKLTATIGDGDVVGGGPAAVGEDVES